MVAVSKTCTKALLLPNILRPIPLRTLWPQERLDQPPNQLIVYVGGLRAFSCRVEKFRAQRFYGGLECGALIVAVPL